MNAIRGNTSINEDESIAEEIYHIVVQYGFVKDLSDRTNIE